ncbi:MAG: 4Fe-4S dicluster domain-containing protein [Myxococcales bacterium FL481]|nr:MAG: 4Fe-4S dicluster domain-containing protein [Myxococcales bacterium FL481]
MPPLTRRGLLRGVLEREPAPSPAESTRARTTPGLPPRRRPPGAVAEALFLRQCDGCRDCVTACPHHAVYTLAEHVGIGAGTPVMLPHERACWMCTGFPCAQACPTDALTPPQGETWPLGTVRLVESRCLPFLGPECGACRGLCPAGVEALTIRNNRPVVDAVACVGCGKCIEACPVRPRALELVELG